MDLDKPDDEDCEKTIKVLKYITRKTKGPHYRKINKKTFQKIEKLARKFSAPYYEKKEGKRIKKIQIKDYVREKSGIEQSQREKNRKYHALYQTNVQKAIENKSEVITPAGATTLIIHCYICKKNFTPTLGNFYDQLCSDCTTFNLEKRNQTRDLTGKVAVVTGVRVKIGFEICLKLLRSGCFVIGITRFPYDALRRYQAESDFNVWKNQLQLFGLDLRYLSLLEDFTRYLKTNYKKIDFLINNACQTIFRPHMFYEEVAMEEKRLQGITNNNNNIITMQSKGSSMVDQKEDFPLKCYDDDHQQVDLRKTTSWQLTLPEVETRELLETQCINYFAPYILIRNLTSLMESKDNTQLSYIVNVSAMEGSFSHNKTAEHPHTNAAKAALNMLTRTSGLDYKNKYGISMNSIDTGWISNYNKNYYEKWNNPIDNVDGAARVLDLIFTQSDLSGYFWKDYKICSW